MRFLLSLTCSLTVAVAHGQRSNLMHPATEREQSLALEVALVTPADGLGASPGLKLSDASARAAHLQAVREIATLTDRTPGELAAPSLSLGSDAQGRPVLLARGADYLWEASLRTVDGAYELPQTTLRRLCILEAPCEGEVVMERTSCSCGGEAGELRLQLSSM